jgi:hypothetical protein
MASMRRFLASGNNVALPTEIPATHAKSNGPAPSPGTSQIGATGGTDNR